MDRPDLRVVSHDLGMGPDPTYVIPLSDLHIGAGFNERKFAGYRDWILERDNAYCVVLGDVIDNAIKESIGDTYGTMRPKEQKALAVEVLAPLAERGKILAWLDGNHEVRTSKRTDEFVGETITRQLGIYDVYDPDGMFMFLSVGWDRKHNKKSRNTYSFFMLHGYTGARTISGKAKSLEDMKLSVFADIYLAAHAHQKIVFPSYRVLPEGRTKTLRYTKSMHIMAGSFQQWAGYAVRKNYQPTPMGSPRIRLDSTRKDVHVSI